MKKRNVLLREFVIQIYADGFIDFDGFDEFLWWQVHRKPEEGYLPHVDRISKFESGEYLNKPKKKARHSPP